MLERGLCYTGFLLFPVATAGKPFLLFKKMPRKMAKAGQ
jgi:hypothetical protein